MMKSPIEKQLHHAFWQHVPQNTVLADRTAVHVGRFDVEKMYLSDSGIGEEFEVVGSGSTSEMVAIYSDVAILSYRVDFLICIDDNGSEGWLAVECDGHDFHDRTKQQAASDRSRDRELLIVGIPTIRFTGSEIHHDADRCANEIWRTIDALRRPAIREQHAFQRGWKCGEDHALGRKIPL